MLNSFNDGFDCFDDSFRWFDLVYEFKVFDGIFIFFQMHLNVRAISIEVRVFKLDILFLN